MLMLRLLLPMCTVTELSNYRCVASEKFETAESDFSVFIILGRFYSVQF